jgi:DNA-directed RNA polymerase specialized sigma24 family protein
MDQLPDQERAVLLLVAIEDLSYANVAQILGNNASPRGRERLRQLDMEARMAGRRMV